MLPAISLFSGVGGLDLGVTLAGFDVRGAVEHEADAAASLRANQFLEHPDRVLEGVSKSTASTQARRATRQCHGGTTLAGATEPSGVAFGYA